MKVPHVIAYQGSKRKLAERICAYIPTGTKTLWEPFAGSAAITIYAASHGLAKHYVISDTLGTLVDLHRLIVEQPKEVAASYRATWTAQGNTPEARYAYFMKVREDYNKTKEPSLLLFLALRCVANAIRFSGRGNFSQSPDKRRSGTHPDRVEENIFAVSSLLKGKCAFHIGDFTATTATASKGDIIYLDPPYQGTSDGTDKRYFEQLDRTRLEKYLREKAELGIPCIVSYDGSHGEKTYGVDLPVDIGMTKFSLIAGRSTQGTLSGREIVTTESLYVSPSLLRTAQESLALM